MKRMIIDYSKLTDEILDLLVEKYPDGYKSKDILIYRNAANEVIECVEVRTDDTVYLVKVGKRLIAAMEDYEEDSDDDYGDDQDDDFGEYDDDPDL